MRSVAMLVLVGLAVCCGTARAQWHSIDTAEPFGNVSLSELLRGIQFYNAGEFHCEDGTEDGYAPGGRGPGVLAA